MIVIPAFINSILSAIFTYPKFCNFLFFQVTPKNRYNIKKNTISLFNKGIENIKIRKVFIEYENIFLNGNNYIISPNEEIKYGLLISNGNIMKNLENKKRDLSGKKQKGLLYIETNSTE